MAAITAIFFCVTLAWIVLGSSVLHKTWVADDNLRTEVSGLWGSPQEQLTPELEFAWKVIKREKETVKDERTGRSETVTREKVVWETTPVSLDGSKIEVDLSLDQRKKGLLWYSTYVVRFDGRYRYVHDDKREGRLIINHRFPTSDSTYDDFKFLVNGKADPEVVPAGSDGVRIVRREIPVSPGSTVPFEIGYSSRGQEWWMYSFGDNVNQVRDFRLTMTTDFDAIDFPGGTISPSSKSRTSVGWRLGWEFRNLISGCRIGMDMPKRLNPGPLAAEISYFAPISLGFFFVWMFVITLLRGINLHPMNYLFLGAAFFAFHLMFAYTVDHIPVIPAFLLASVTSVFLVVSYLRLVVGMRFAALEAGVSQLVYLVLFSYAHFLQNFTGLFLTIGSILTLFVLMQLTGKTDWASKFRSTPDGGLAKQPLPSPR
jgi:hypothetical protein